MLYKQSKSVIRQNRRHLNPLPHLVDTSDIKEPKIQNNELADQMTNPDPTDGVRTRSAQISKLPNRYY